MSVPTYAQEPPADRKGEDALDRHTGPQNTLYPQARIGKPDRELKPHDLVKKYGTAAEAQKALEHAAKAEELRAPEEHLALPPPAEESK